MSQDPIIRAARPSDAVAILQLIRELAVYEKLENEVVATEASLSHHLFGPEPKCKALIVEIEGKIAGFALYFYNFSTFLGKPGLYLEDLFIRPEFRGSGLGKTVLQKLAAIAVEEGCGRFEWWVLDWNEPSINFYKRMGAKPMDEWTVFRVEGARLKALAAGEPMDIAA